MSEHPPVERSPRRVGRRMLPLGALAAGAVAGLPATASAATDTALGGLTADDRHLVRRFSYGFDGVLASRVRRAGGGMAWFNQQLNPAAIDDAAGDAVGEWFPNLRLKPQQLWARFPETITSSSASDDLASFALMKRTCSSRQVLEVMTEFWSNLLHVPSPSEKAWPQRAEYDAVIRANALGTFSDLLRETITHPAMLLYLDNYLSTADAPNENLGREVLECHTVGRETPYTEADVLNSTRILTGWAVDRGQSWNGFYDASGHWTGDVRVMGFQDANAARDGRATTYAYLEYLAQHPATARRIAEKLVTRFVADVPSATLVNDVAQAFTASNTDIKATLRALVTHPEFTSSADDKVRTPTEDYIATVRALRIAIRAPRNDSDFANHSLWLASSMGQRPFDWPSPDGFPDAGPAWSSVSRMLGSWTIHQSMSGTYRNVQAEFRPPTFWLPDLPARFEKVVETFCRRLLFEPPTPTVMQAACQSVGVRPTEVITWRHGFVHDRIPLLLSCLLDSPIHMKR